MLTELNEADATCDIARIYADIRHLCAVPYVSALYRHLATRPGVLPWAWAAVSPALDNGTAQEAGWRVAADLPLDPLPPIPRDALRVWGVDASAEQAVRNVCDGFVRVAPVNMVFAGLLKRFIAGEVPNGKSASATWQPPADIPAPPPLVDPAKLDAAQRGVLMQFATTSGGKPFVPGLYRMLAHWPGLLAHLSVVMAPRLASAATVAAFNLVRARIDTAVPEVFAQMSAPGALPPAPSADERANILAALETYRKTSPELIVFGRLIRDALPLTSSSSRERAEGTSKRGDPA
jgi:hypothetical protein